MTTPIQKSIFLNQNPKASSLPSSPVQTQANKVANRIQKEFDLSAHSKLVAGLRKTSCFQHNALQMLRDADVLARPKNSSSRAKSENDIKDINFNEVNKTEASKIVFSDFLPK